MASVAVVFGLSLFVNLELKNLGQLALMCQAMYIYHKVVISRHLHPKVEWSALFFCDYWSLSLTSHRVQNRAISGVTYFKARRQKARTFGQSSHLLKLFTWKWIITKPWKPPNSLRILHCIIVARRSVSILWICSQSKGLLVKGATIYIYIYII